MRRKKDISTTGRKEVHIKELRMTVYTRLNETEEQTRERYLKNSYIYKNGRNF